MESGGAARPGGRPRAETPYAAALSDEPWPTMRTVVAPRSRAAAAIRAYSLSCSSSERSACGCSRISARRWAPGSAARASAAGSGDDTRLPADEDALDLEVVVEHHHVGRQPGLEPPDRRDPDHTGGHGARGIDRLRQRDA